MSTALKAVEVEEAALAALALQCLRDASFEMEPARRLMKRRIRGREAEAVDWAIDELLRQAGKDARHRLPSAEAMEASGIARGGPGGSHARLTRYYSGWWDSYQLYDKSLLSMATLPKLERQVRWNTSMADGNARVARWMGRLAEEHKKRSKDKPNVPLSKLMKAEDAWKIRASEEK